MSERTFDRETLLDLTVNVIPLGIILFFVVVFLLVTPWEPDLFTQAVSMALLVIPFVALALLTFISGRAVAQAEERNETAAADDSAATDGELAETQASGDDTDETVAEPLNNETDTADETESTETTN